MDGVEEGVVDVVEVVVLAGTVEDDGEEEDGIEVIEKESEGFEEAMLQNCWARASALLSSAGHPCAIHPVRLCVKFALLRSRSIKKLGIRWVIAHLLQKQFTSTTLVQLAAELPSAKHCDTFFVCNENKSELASKSQDSPHDEYPLKLGNSALLVGVAVVVELLALALVLELAPLGAVAVEDTVGNVDDGTSVADPHAVDVNWQTMSKRMGSIVQQRFSVGNLEEERTS